MSDKEFFEFFQKVDAGVQAGTALALDEHRRMGRSIVIWKDGERVVLTGDEIPVSFPVAGHSPSR